MATPTIQSLEAEVKKLQSMVAGLSTNTKKNNNPVKPASKSVSNVGSTIGDQIIDIVWNKYFYFSTFFESLDGWYPTGTGTTSLNDTGVTLTTGAVASNSITIDKAPLNDSRLSFDKDSRFRTTATFSNNTNISVDCGVGNVISGKPCYGFLAVNGTLYGFTGNGTSTTSVVLQTLSAVQVVQLEARYYSKNRVDFYATTTQSPTSVVLLGSISTTLPTGTMISAGQFWLNMTVVTTTTAPRSITINSMEYIQQR